jgi:hypothetical protein
MIFSHRIMKISSVRHMPPTVVAPTSAVSVDANWAVVSPLSLIASSAAYKGE